MKRRRQPAVSLRTEFTTDEVQALVMQAIADTVPADAGPGSGGHQARAGGAQALSGAPSARKLAEALTEALCCAENHVGMGMFMALISVKKFRYTRDPNKKESLVMLRYNGAVYEPRPGPQDMDVAAQTTTVVVLKNLQELLGAMEEDPEGGGREETEGDKERRIQNELRGRVSELLNRQLGNNTYLNHVRKQMHDVMATDAFYTDNEMMTPGEFFVTLDSNPNLMGFPNGVMNFRAPGCGMRFYRRGEVPPTFAVSMSVGYDYAGNADGTPRGEAQKLEMEEVMDKFHLVFLQQAFGTPPASSLAASPMAETITHGPRSSCWAPPGMPSPGLRKFAKSHLGRSTTCHSPRL